MQPSAPARRAKTGGGPWDFLRELLAEPAKALKAKAANAISFAAAVSACVNAGQISQAMRLLLEFEARSLPATDVFCSTALMACQRLWPHSSRLSHDSSTAVSLHAETFTPFPQDIFDTSHFRCSNPAVSALPAYKHKVHGSGEGCLDSCAHPRKARNWQHALRLLNLVHAFRFEARRDGGIW